MTCPTRLYLVGTFALLTCHCFLQITYIIMYNTSNDKIADRSTVDQKDILKINRMLTHVSY